MTRKYDITGSSDKVDQEKFEWLKKNLRGDQFMITDDGFIYGTYRVIFNDSAAEMLYVLRWS